MSAGDVVGYYTSIRYTMEHISAIVERSSTEWDSGEPLCRSVQPRAVPKSVRRRSPLVELRAIVNTPPRLAFIRCTRCQVAARRLLSDSEADR